MSDYLFVSFLVIIIGIVGIRYPEFGGRTWGTVEEVREDPEKVAERTKKRNRTFSIIILVLGVLLLILSVT